MREILFRGFCTDYGMSAIKIDGIVFSGEWVYGGIVHQTDYYGDAVDRYFIIDGTETNDNDIGYEYEVIPETIGEYTGIVDSNGAKVFEGDRILSYYPCEDDSEYVIKYNCEKGYPAFDCDPYIDCDCNGLSYLSEDCDATFEVIGTIFDE